MADGMDIRITGLHELIRDFGQVPGAVREVGLQRAVQAGAAVLIPEIQARAPRGRTGKLAGSVKVRMLELSQAQALLSVRPRVRYVHLVELGHVMRHPKPKGDRVRRGRRTVIVRRTDRAATKGVRLQLPSGRWVTIPRDYAEVGRVPAHPFIQPAVDASRERVARAIWQTLLDLIEPYLQPAAYGAMAHVARTGTVFLGAGFQGDPTAGGR